MIKSSILDEVAPLGIRHWIEAGSLRCEAPIRSLNAVIPARTDKVGRREILGPNIDLQRDATATPATVATETGLEVRSVAEVASVAVAKDENGEIERGVL